MSKRIRRGDPQRRSYWEDVVRRWGDGGRSVRSLCRAEGVRESAFYFWRRRLSGRNGRVAPGHGKRAPSRIRMPSVTSSEPPSPPPSATPSFLPVRFVGDRPAATASGLEILLAHGRTLRVFPGFDRQALVDVLAVLEAPSC
jgi:transposase-like protein